MTIVHGSDDAIEDTADSRAHSHGPAPRTETGHDDTEHRLADGARVPTGGTV